MRRRGLTGSVGRPAATSGRQQRALPRPQAWRPTDSAAIATILVVDADSRLRSGLATYLRKRGHSVETAADAGAAIRVLTGQSFDVVFADVRIAHMEGPAFLREIHQRSPDARLVLMATRASVAGAVEAIRTGAHDYLAKPIDPSEVEPLLGRMLAMRAQRRESPPPQHPSEPWPLLASANATMQRAIATARQVAASDAAVLLMGESGTGKSVLAAAIHAWSQRAGGPFVTVPCATLADHLIDSEFFGHDEGGFTGRWKDKPGSLEAAAGGTLLLDEVGDLQLPVQGRLVRLLADEVDARIISTTNRALDVEVRAGRFREDLFFLLNVVTIALPPLRDRPEDQEPLTDYILARLATRHGRARLTLSPEVRDILAAHRWPGNVRELANTLERAVVLSREDVISAKHLSAPASSGIAARPSGPLSLKALERRQIEQVLRDSETLDEAAARLGIHPTTLWRKRKRWGLFR